MRVLVVGGTAFIGRYTVQELLERGHDVSLFHRGITLNPFGEQVEDLRGDRLDPRAVQQALSGRRFHAVVDLVYAWGPGTGPQEVSSVLDAVGEDLNRYVFLSTCGVYARGPMPFTEESPRGPSMGQYSTDKIATEDYLMGEHEAGRTVASIVRPPHVYGPHNNVPREAWFWDRIVAGRPVIVPDRGESLTHLVAVQDVAWALAECVTNEVAAGEVFNIAEETHVSQTDLIDRLAEAAARPVEKAFVPRDRIYDLGGDAFGSPLYFGVSLDLDVDFSVDITKARQRLGFRPTDPLEGLREAFAWYMKEDRARTPKFTFDRRVLGR